MDRVVLNLSVPERLLVALEVSPAKMGDELRMAAAVKLYELERLSSGAAAELAGVPRQSRGRLPLQARGIRGRRLPP